MSLNSASSAGSGSGSAESAALDDIAIDVHFETASTASPSASAAAVQVLSLSGDLRKLLISTDLMRYESDFIKEQILSINDILEFEVRDLRDGLGLTLMAANKLKKDAWDATTSLLSSPSSPSSSSSSPSQLSPFSPPSPSPVVFDAATFAVPSAPAAPDRSFYTTSEVVGDGKRNYLFDREKDIIGDGTFGSVYKCALEETIEKIFAVKIISKRKLRNAFGLDDFSCVEKEISLLSTLSESGHINIVKFIVPGMNSENYWIVMEYIAGDNLRVYVQNKQRALTAAEAEPIFSQLCDALHFLHKDKSPPIIHRDIKPDNIMITQDSKTGDLVVKLVDFGIAKRPGTRDPMTGKMGTPGYIAPEVNEPRLDANGEVIPYGVAADCYALGGTLYFMLAKLNPGGDPDTFLKRGLAKIDSPNGRELVEKLMCKDPYLRMNIEEAKNSVGALADPQTTLVVELVRTEPLSVTHSTPAPNYDEGDGDGDSASNLTSELDVKLSAPAEKFNKEELFKNVTQALAKRKGILSDSKYSVEFLRLEALKALSASP